jgi:hypothetical protein
MPTPFFLPFFTPAISRRTIPNQSSIPADSSQLHSRTPIAIRTQSALQVPMSLDNQPKRTLTKAACDQCRSRKIKCDAQHPSCSGCVKVAKGCNYATAPAESRSQAVKRKYQELQSANSTYHQIFDVLQIRTPQEGEEILHHIQSGADAKTVLKRVHDRDMSLQLSVTPYKEHHCRCCSLMHAATNPKDGQASLSHHAAVDLSY